MRRSALSLLALGLSATLGACGTAPGPTPTAFLGTVTLPTFDTAVCAGIGTDATLTGDPADPRVAWLESGGQRVDAVFPVGFTARFTPKLEVLDAHGVVVAQEGTHIDGGCVAGDYLLIFSGK